MNNTPKYLHDILGMHFFTAEDQSPCAEMDVTENVCQPFGFLSGGATLALAETLAGYASLSLCPPKTFPVGMQISANHLNSVKLGGKITAKARLLKNGGTLHVWEISVADESGTPVSVCQITNYIKKG